MRCVLLIACLPLLLLSACGSGSSPSASSSSPSASSSSSASQSSTSSGSSSSSTTASNVVPMTVDAGPSGLSEPELNVPYVSVEICVPGTSSCQTIDDIEVDTGSYGLRIISSALSSSLNLPAETAQGDPILECTTFVDGFVWGPVVTADVQVGGETAQNVPIQIMGGSSYTLPNDCGGNGMMEEDTLSLFGANGVLGVGPYAQDCGDLCTSVPTGDYYVCPSTDNCQASTVTLDEQVINPVALFPVDNNGVILELPSIPSQGAVTATGSLIFGIDTEDNNALGNVTVLHGDTSFDGNSYSNSSSGEIETTFNGQTYDSYIDSGSNLFFFPDSSIQQCPKSLSGFYCPTSTLSNLSATNIGTEGTQSTVTFTIVNALDYLEANESFTAFDDFGGAGSGSFDFGLPFFYGRHVYFAMYGHNTSQGEGPFFAY